MLQIPIVNAMNEEVNNSIITNINLTIQKISNNFVNKLVYGTISSCTDCNQGKLLYLYKRVLETRTFDDNELLSTDEYNDIYINVQQIIKKTWVSQH
jgi:hypothetical protein